MENTAKKWTNKAVAIVVVIIILGASDSLLLCLSILREREKERERSKRSQLDLFCVKKVAKRQNTSNGLYELGLDTLNVFLDFECRKGREDARKICARRRRRRLLFLLLSKTPSSKGVLVLGKEVFSFSALRRVRRGRDSSGHNASSSETSSVQRQREEQQQQQKR